MTAAEACQGLNPIAGRTAAAAEFGQHLHRDLNIDLVVVNQQNL